MEVLSEINFLPIIVAPILTLLIRFVWYSDIFLGPTWAKLIDMSPAEKSKFPFMSYSYFFLVNSVLVTTISSIASLTNSSGVLDGIGLGLMIAVGIGIPIMIPQYIFAQMDVKLVGIDVFFQLINVLTISILISAV